MESILLTFIICLILAASIGINIVIRILRSIPSFMGQGAYGPPVLGAGSTRQENNDNKSGSSFTWILLIVTAASFWLMVSRKMTTESDPITPSFPNTEESVISEEQEEMPGLEYYRPEVKPPESSINSQDQPPLTLIRLNSKPSVEVLPNSFFYIQLGSFANSDNARDKADHSSLIYQNVAVIYSEGFYKVILGPFTSKESAKAFMKRNRIKKVFVNSIGTNAG